MNNIVLNNTKISGVKKTENDNIKLVYSSFTNNNHDVKTRKIIYGKAYFSGDVVYALPAYEMPTLKFIIIYH